MDIKGLVAAQVFTYEGKQGSSRETVGKRQKKDIICPKTGKLSNSWSGRCTCASTSGYNPMKGSKPWQC